MMYTSYSRQLLAPRDSKAIKQFFEKACQIDLKKWIRDTFLDGFETYEDYEKYGNLFIWKDDDE